MRLANHRNRANKLAFIPYGKIDIKYSTDGGSTWTDAGVSNATKAKLFTGIQSDSIYIGPNNSTTTRTTSMKTQITITSERATILDQLYLLFHSNSHQLTVDVKGATYNKTDYDSHKYVESFAIGTWVYNSVLDMSAFRFQTSESESSYISKLQITFSYTSVGSGSSPAQLFGILGYGGADWWTSTDGPNNMAMYDHIYRWNENKETIFPADIYVGSTKVSLNGHTHNYTPYSTNPIDSSTTPSVSFNKEYSSNGITTSNLPKTWNMGFSAAFVASGSGWGSFGSVFTLRTYGEGGGTLQMYVPYSPTYGGSRLKARFGNYDSSGGNSWTDLKEIAWLDDASKVLQEAVTASSYTYYRPLVFGDYSSSTRSGFSPTSTTAGVKTTSSLYCQPSTQTIYARMGQIAGSGRLTSANLSCVGSTSVQMLIATSTMTTGKPGNDGYILDFDWDTTGSWKAQIFVPCAQTPGMQWREQHGSSNWSDTNNCPWRTLLDNKNWQTYIDASMSNLYANDNGTDSVANVSLGSAMYYLRITVHDFTTGVRSMFTTPVVNGDYSFTMQSKVRSSGASSTGGVGTTGLDLALTPILISLTSPSTGKTTIRLDVGLTWVIAASNSSSSHTIKIVRVDACRY